MEKPTADTLTLAEAALIDAAATLGERIETVCDGQKHAVMGIALASVLLEMLQRTPANEMPRSFVPLVEELERFIGVVALYSAAPATRPPAPARH